MNENPIPKDLRSDHLFLLIGTNPLPNYVAARLLCNEGGQLYLVHSADTRKIAERLQTTLGIMAQQIEVNEANATEIRQKICSAMQGVDSGGVGLHYTGGTKVMAVHAHHTFLEAMETYHPDQKPVCSYLDARTYQMKFDPTPDQGGFGENVLQSEPVPLETVLKLHDINLTRGALETQVRLPKSARMLAKLHTDRDIASKWREWCKDELRKKTWKKGKWITKQSQLEQITLNLSKAEVFQEFNEQLCLELGLPANNTLPLGEIRPEQIFRKTYHILAWLDGIWLENYVFDEIEAITDEVGLTDKAMSLNTSQSPGKPNFEFDIGVMKGYQLFGLSCSTTQKKGMPKSKLFEAYIRARQLGGDEARVAVVCPQPDLRKKLEKELPGSFEGKVRIFDSAHLEDLRDELKIWFQHPDNQ